VPIECVQFGLGDSAMPMAPQQGGSGLTAALGNAVQTACLDLVRAFVNRVSDDDLSPVRGCRLETVTVRDGGIQITDDPARFDTYADILTRHGLDEITSEAESAPPGETSSATMVPRGGRFVPFTIPSTAARAHAGACATHFVEVHVDPDLGTIRVARSSRPWMAAGFSTRRRPAVRSSGASPAESAWRCWRTPCRTVPAVW
jgi:xanthine dehydrogenase YagR molybdenum-binding subunit